MSDAADAEATERDAEDRAEIEAIRQALANSGTALAVAARLNAGVMEESRPGRPDAAPGAIGRAGRLRGGTGELGRQPGAHGG